MLSMGACSSRNPDALASPNTEQGRPDIDLNNALNAVAAAPANSGDVGASAASAVPPTRAPEPAASSVSTQKVSLAGRSSPTKTGTMNATAAPDAAEEAGSDATPEEPTNSVQVAEPQIEPELASRLCLQ